MLGEQDGCCLKVLLDKFIERSVLVLSHQKINCYLVTLHHAANGDGWIKPRAPDSQGALNVSVVSVLCKPLYFQNATFPNNEINNPVVFSSSNMSY